jgi:hypothetical protein
MIPCIPMTNLNNLIYTLQVTLVGALSLSLYTEEHGDRMFCAILSVAWHNECPSREDKSGYSELANKLANITGCCVSVPNYRLTSPALPIRHPAHAADILQYLVHAVSNSNETYDPSRLYLIGHSCSTHMISSIVLDSSHNNPSLSPPQDVLDAIRGLMYTITRPGETFILSLIFL